METFNIIQGSDPALSSEISRKCYGPQVEKLFIFFPKLSLYWLWDIFSHILSMMMMMMMMMMMIADDDDDDDDQMMMMTTTTTTMMMMTIMMVIH